MIFVPPIVVQAAESAWNRVSTALVHVLPTMHVAASAGRSWTDGAQATISFANERTWEWFRSELGSDVVFALPIGKNVAKWIGIGCAVNLLGVNLMFSASTEENPRKRGLKRFLGAFAAAAPYLWLLRSVQKARQGK